MLATNEITSSNVTIPLRMSSTTGAALEINAGTGTNIKWMRII
jgi:hypothetical protein